MEDLSPAEMAELESLRKEFGGGISQAPPVSDLTPDEEAELLALRQEFSQPQESARQLPTGLSPREMAELGVKPEQQFRDGNTQAFIEGLGNEITLGYLPHIQAGIEKLYTPDQSYVDLRDENLKRQQMQQEKYPEDVMAGQLSGALISTPIMGAAGKAAGLAKDATRLGRLGQSVGTGAAFGAFRNPGDTEGQVDPLQVNERITNTVTGGVIGGSGQSVLEVGSGLVGALAKSSKVAQSAAKKFAFQSLGAGKREVKKLLGTGAPEEIGDLLIKEGIVKPGSSVEDMLPGIQEVKSRSGKALGDLIDEASTYVNDPNKVKKLGLQQRNDLLKTELDGENIANVANYVISKKYKNNLDTSQAKPRVEAILENLRIRKKNLSVRDLQDMKVELDGVIDWSKSAKEAPAIQEQLREVRGLLNNSIQDRLNAVGNATGKSDMLLKLRVENRKYGRMATAERIARDKISANEANRFYSLTDYIAGGATGALVGDIDSPEDLVKKGLYGLVGATANRGMRRYSLPVLSRVAGKLGNALKSPSNLARYGQPLIEAAKKSPVEFSALLNQLSTDPEFRKLISLP